MAEIDLDRFADVRDLADNSSLDLNLVPVVGSRAGAE